MFRYLRWIALGIGLVLLLIAVGLGVYSNTEGFRRLVREQLVAAINSSIRGTVTLERIEGSVWGDLTLHDVRLRYQDFDIVRIARLKLSYALLPLVFGRLQIARAEAAEPAVQIVRDEQGRWNIAEALSSDDTSESQFAVVLSSLALRQGSLDLRILGTEPQEYRLRNVLLDGRLTVDPKGVVFDADEISARLQSKTLPELGLKGSLAYLDAGSPPIVKVHGLVLESAASHLQLSGDVTDFDKPKIAAKLAIDKLGAADIVRFAPDWPVKQGLAGTIAANGPLEALTVALDIGQAGAKATGNFIIDATAPAPRFRGTIKLAGVDARTWLASDQGVAGVLDGSAEVTGVGVDLAQLAGAGNFNIRAAEVKGWKLGDLRLQTKLHQSTALLSGDLTGALGGAEWRGNVTLSQVPRYEFDFAVKNLDIAKVSAEGKSLGGVLNLKGAVKGSGVTLAQLSGQTNLEILPSTIGSVNLRKGELVASLAGGRIRIARGSLITADSSLAVKGDIGVDLAQQGRLDYELRSENISPWLALAGESGSGSLTLAGSAQGNLTELKSRGALKVANLGYGKLALKSGAVDFNLARTAQQPIPSGDVVARLSGVRAGVELQKLDATAKLGTASGSARIDVKAQDGSGRIHTLQSAIDYSQADVIATLSQASFSLPDGMWKLAAPATLSKRGDTFNVQNLTLRNGAKAAALDGELAMTGTQRLNLTVDRFPLEGLATFFSKQPAMNGLLALRAQVGGTAAAPEITGTINLTDAKIGGQSYAGLVADLSYRERQANLNLTVRQDATHMLTATGRLPLLLSWQDGWRSDITGDMDVRVQSAGLSLAFLNAYTAKTVSDLSGEISVDLTARGRPAAPALSGSFRLRDGKLRATLLNVPVDSVTAEGSFDARVIRIQKLSARANDGTFSGSGLLTLQNYQIDNFKLSLAARRWPAIDTRRYRAQIGGAVEIDGSPAAPRLTGKVDVTEADLRPDLAFLEQSSTAVKRDATIVVVNRDGSERVAPVKTSSTNGFGESELFKALTLDLTLRMPNNVRVRHADASAELRGNIHATKKPGQALQLVGNSEIIRGWATFQGRRFDIVRGDIEFIGGGKIDPALDILAQHRLPQYTVEALVGGTVEKPTLVLRSDPILDQSDILALLVFGKPTKDLNSSEQVSLKQSALDVTTGFAAANMGAAIAEALGLESLGVGDINFTGGRVGLGRYLGRRTYVTVNQELAGERGQQASVEVQLAPDWKIGTSTSTKGASEVELIWHKRY